GGDVELPAVPGAAMRAVTVSPEVRAGARRRIVALARRAAGATAGLRSERWRRRLLWSGLAVACFLPLLLTQSGRDVADTRLPVYTDTWHYLVHSFRVWQPAPLIGSEQHDGLIFPMATIVWLLRLTGLTLWAVERLWYGL